MEMELSTPPTLHQQIRNCFLQISNDLDNLTDRQLEQIYDCIKKIFFDKVFDENKELIQQTKELKRQMDKCVKQKTHIEERYHKRSRQLDECISEKNQMRQEFNKGKAQYDQISKEFELLSERFNRGKEQFEQLMSEKEELKREIKLEKDMLRENISENKDLKRQLHECSQLLNKCRDELNNQKSSSSSRQESPPRASSRQESPPRAYSRPKSPPRAYSRPKSPPRSRPKSPPRASSRQESPPRSRPNPQSIELNEETLKEITNCGSDIDINVMYNEYKHYKQTFFLDIVKPGVNIKRLNIIFDTLIRFLGSLRDALKGNCIDKSGLNGDNLYNNYSEWFREEYKNIKSKVDNYNLNKELNRQLKFANKTDTIYGGIPKIKNNKTKKTKKTKEY